MTQALYDSVRKFAGQWEYLDQLKSLVSNDLNIEIDRNIGQLIYCTNQKVQDDLYKEQCAADGFSPATDALCESLLGKKILLVQGYGGIFGIRHTLGRLVKTSNGGYAMLPKRNRKNGFLLGEGSFIKEAT